MTAEQWRPIPGFPKYEASNHGRILSRRRTGTPRILTGTPGPCGFRTVTLSALLPNGRTQRIGALVALAFIGPPPSPDSELRRLDANPLNDRPENLAWGTPAEVDSDHAARARREEAAGAPTHCPEGHRYADSWLNNWGQRDCPPCRIAALPQNRRPDPVTPCIDCGTAVRQDGGPVAPWFKRCPDCRAAEALEAQRRYQAKAVRRPRLSVCQDCRVQITNRPTGPPALRCGACRKKAQRETDRRYRLRQQRRTERAA